MSIDEESKKIAKIEPSKIHKAVTEDELDAHKKQLEQYYSGKNVDDVEKIISDTKSLSRAEMKSRQKANRTKPYILTILFLFFLFALILVLSLGLMFKYDILAL